MKGEEKVIMKELDLRGCTAHGSVVFYPAHLHSRYKASDDFVLVNKTSECRVNTAMSHDATAFAHRLHLPSPESHVLLR